MLTIETIRSAADRAGRPLTVKVSRILQASIAAALTVRPIAALTEGEQNRWGFCFQSTQFHSRESLCEVWRNAMLAARSEDDGVRALALDSGAAALWHYYHYSGPTPNGDDARCVTAGCMQLAAGALLQAEPDLPLFESLTLARAAAALCCHTDPGATL